MPSHPAPITQRQIERIVRAARRAAPEAVVIIEGPIARIVLSPKPGDRPPPPAPLAPPRPIML